jgi:hypothetical protein
LELFSWVLCCLISMIISVFKLLWLEQLHLIKLLFCLDLGLWFPIYDWTHLVSFLFCLLYFPFLTFPLGSSF